MRIIPLNTAERAICYELEVMTSPNCKLRIKCIDPKRENTVFIDRIMTFSGKGKIQLPMPISAETTELLIGTTNKGKFNITRLSEIPLKTKFAAFDFKNSSIYDFLKFACEFCGKAGYLSASDDTVYLSNDSKYRVDYMRVIRSLDDKKPLNTPARISQTYGVIEISKYKFMNYTVPMRMIILLHEFAHYYQNLVMRDEQEADFHAVNIYLGMGFPSVEALKAFALVFYGADTPSNRERFKKMEFYVKSFHENTSNVLVIN